MESPISFNTHDSVQGSANAGLIIYLYHFGPDG
jgi:hypothetical protein